MKCGGPKLVLVAVLMLTSAAWPQKASEVGAKHDLGGQGCALCHAAQTSAPPAGAQNPSGTMWDRNLSSRSFHTYDVPFSSSKPAAKGEPLPLRDPELRMSSMLCVSCHDGVGTPTMLEAPVGASAAATGANILRSGHPVNVPHDPAKDSGLMALADVSKGLKLFGPSNTVQCSTCHDVHSPQNSVFLRNAKKASELCVACHL